MLSSHVFDSYVGATIVTGRVSNARRADKEEKRDYEERKSQHKKLMVDYIL